MVDARKVFDRMKFHDVVSWTSLILGYVDNGDSRIALELFTCMETQGSCTPDARTFVAALKACALDDQGCDSEKIEKGRTIHSQAREMGFESDIFVTSSLIDMYSKFGSVTDARKVFDGLACPAIVSWNVMLLGYVENGQGELALELFESMQHRGWIPDARTFVAALKACSSLVATEGATQVDSRARCLETAGFIRRMAASSGCDSELVVANTLLDTYVKCGSLIDAQRVFERMQWRDTVSWTVMLVGYVEAGEEQAGLDILEASADDVIPDAAMFVAALKACSSLAAKEQGSKLGVLDKGMAIHSRARSCGCDGDVFVANTLVDMYSKCGSLRDSRIVFDSMQFHSVVSWNSLILAYGENGEEELALACFAAVAAATCGSQDQITYVAALKACTSLSSKEEAKVIEDGAKVKLGSLDRGMELHSRASKHGYDGEVKVANSMVDMYSKCGSLVDARRVFDRMPYSSIVSWNSLLQGYVDNGESEVALELFRHLQTAGCESCDSRTYAAVLKACSASSAMFLPAAKSVHAAVCRSGLLDDNHNVLVSSLVDSYAKSGRMLDSQQVFDSMNRSACIITWNSLMAGYCAQGDTKAVLAALHRMQDEGLQADAITLVSILCACAHTGQLETAKAYFNAFLRRSDVKLAAQHYHCMLDALGRGNRLKEAIELVESMPFAASGVAWNSLLAACCKWSNVEVGKVVFDRFVKSESGSSESAGYMLMVKLFGSAGLWLEQKRVLETMSSKLKIFSPTFHTPYD